MPIAIMTVIRIRAFNRVRATGAVVGPAVVDPGPHGLAPECGVSWSWSCRTPVVCVAVIVETPCCSRPAMPPVHPFVAVCNRVRAFCKGF